MRNVRLAVGVCALAILTVPAARPAPAADLSGSYTWKPVKIGGGGFVTGVVIHPNVDNVVYCRTDVGGAYKWNAGTGQWTQLMTASRMPSGVMTANGGNPGTTRTRVYQVESIGIAPSDSNVVFAAVGNDLGDPGWLLKSTNAGASWALTNLAVPMGGNAEYRTYGERLAVQPNNASVVLFGSRNQGLWRSTDGGINWSQVSTSAVPVGSKIDGHDVGACVVVFDPQTPARAYCSVAGVGIYKSEDAGAAWSQILGSAQWAGDMEVVGGTLVVCGSRAGIGVRKYTPAGGWTTVSPNGRGDVEDIAVDPSNNSRIYAQTGGGFNSFWRSTNGGTSWTELGTHTRDTAGRSHFRSTGIPWVENSTVRNWLSVGELRIDPRNTGRMWFAEGMGMWRSTDVSDTNNTPNFDNISQGIEEMVASDVIATPGGKLVTATWDRAGFYQTNPDAFPTAQVGLTNDFSSGWSLATTPANSSFVAMVISDHRGCCGDGVYSGSSTNGGMNWTRFSSNSGGVNTPTDLKFGELVISATNTQNMVWHPRNYTDKIYYTTNGGSSWTQSSVPMTGDWDWDANFFGSRRRLAADGATGGKFYFYSWNDGMVVASTNNGASFTDAGGRLPTAGYWSQLKGAPGRAGHLWYVTGWDSPQGTANGVYRSTNSGGSFSKVATVSEAWAVGFGRSATTGGYPTVFIYGLVSGQWGVFRSTDQGATWDRCVEYPLGLFDKVNAVSGDPDVVGKVYVGFSGNSFAYGVPTSTTPPPPPPSSGSLTRDVWTGISGTAVSAIPTGTTPTSTGTVATFEGPTNVADNYGSRIRGYLTPATTGSYTFWVASDDDSQLWIGTNDQPSTKVQIASVTGWTNSREWGKYTSQRSVARSLTAGTRYYIEALQKEGGGGDNLAVSWRLNNTTTPGNGDGTYIISGGVLSPWNGGATPPPPPPPSTVNITASEDRDNWASNAGNATTVNTSQWQTAYFKFPLASAPANITSARLRVYRGQADQGALTASAFQVTTDTWSENDNASLPAVGPQIGAAVGSSTVGWVEFDVTGWVQSQKSGDGTASIGLTTSTSGWTGWNAKDSATNKPVLVVMGN